MSKVLNQGRQVASLEELEIEELLAKLTPEELEELNNEVDPDNSLLPPSERCKNQTDKAPTGPFCRKRLLKFLEEKARNEKDWEEHEPYTKKTRGKLYVPKPQDNKISDSDMAAMGFDLDIDANIDDTLANATELELVDLAGIMGFTGLLTQEQIQASLENKTQEFGGFNSVVKYTKYKAVPDEPPNDTDIEASIVKLKSNASDLKELNFNNMDDLTGSQFLELCDALQNNSTLTKLSCANTNLTNASAKPILDVLRQNKHLVSLNLESNNLTGEFVVSLLEACQEESSALRVLRLCNQRQRVIGVRYEQLISQRVRENPRLTVLSLDLNTADARTKLGAHLSRNLDRLTRHVRHGNDGGPRVRT